MIDYTAIINIIDEFDLFKSINASDHLSSRPFEHGCIYRRVEVRQASRAISIVVKVLPQCLCSWHPRSVWCNRGSAMLKLVAVRMWCPRLSHAQKYVAPVHHTQRARVQE